MSGLLPLLKIEGVDKMKNELIKAIEEKRLMGYIHSNYHLFTKEELAIVIAELDYNSNRRERDTLELIEDLEERL